jgi:hypothetical protein
MLNHTLLSIASLLLCQRAHPTTDDRGKACPLLYVYFLFSRIRVVAIDIKKAHEVFFDYIFPELTGVAARMDKYYENCKAEYFRTVRDRNIRFNDPPIRIQIGR